MQTIFSRTAPYNDHLIDWIFSFPALMQSYAHLSENKRTVFRDGGEVLPKKRVLPSICVNYNILNCRLS